MKNISNTLIEAIYKQHTDEVLLLLITLSSDDLSYDLRFVNNGPGGDITSRGNVYTAFPFEASLPNDEETGLPSVKISIDNVSQDIIDEVRSITSPITVSMEVILASDPDTVEDGPYDLTLREVGWDMMKIDGTIQGDDILNQRYGEQFTPDIAPGLFG